MPAGAGENSGAAASLLGSFMCNSGGADAGMPPSESLGAQHGIPIRLWGGGARAPLARWSARVGEIRHGRPRNTLRSIQAAIGPSAPAHLDAPAGGLRPGQVGMAGLHLLETSHYIGRKRRRLLVLHVDVQRNVLRSRRHPALDCMEQLLEKMQALGVAVQELDGDPDRVSG